MKLTFLIDNNTLIDRYFLGEPGVSYLIQDGDKQILFDVGYSNTFISNAQKLNLNLLQNDFIVLSHGHSDHTGGLDGLLKLYAEAKIESLPRKKPLLVAHPDAFHPKFDEDMNDIGCTISESKLHQHFEMKLSKKPLQLTQNLYFLGEIERFNDFENREPIGKISANGVTKEDFVWDDTALAYTGKDGLIIITGCSHSGICNIIEYAKKVCNESRVVDVIVSVNYSPSMN